MENPVLPSSCVTPAGTSIAVQNEWEGKKTHTQNVLLSVGEQTPKHFPGSGFLAAPSPLQKNGACRALVLLIFDLPYICLIDLDLSIEICVYKSFRVCQTIYVAILCIRSSSHRDYFQFFLVYYLTGVFQYRTWVSLIVSL